MIIVSSKNTLYSSHYLKNHNGTCKKLHGHQYEITIHLASDYEVVENDECNFLMDFSRLDQIFKKIFPSNHVNINEVTGEDNPSCEFLSKWIFDKLKPDVPQLYCIEVQETPTNICKYFEGEGNYVG